MLDSETVLWDHFTKAQALLERSRAARARSAAVCCEAEAVRQAVDDLLDRTRAIKADLRSPWYSTIDPQPNHAAVEPIAAQLQPEDPKPVERLSASSVVLRALAAADLCEDDLDELVDDLSAAYAEAQARDDDATRTVMAQALIQIGRHLAERVGPKAAGAAIN